MVKRGKHTSLHKDEKAVVWWLEGLRYVDKVLLGRIDPCKHRYPLGYLRPRKGENGTITGNIYSGVGVRKILVMCVSVQGCDAVLQMIEKRFS